MASSVFFDITSLSPLYEDVQLARIFPDSKSFVDCTPKMQADVLLAAYKNARKEPGFDLYAFVASHFILPETPVADYQSGSQPLSKHITTLWSILKRSDDKEVYGTKIPLPHPYIVPGGRFRELYYWDSYFTMLGLQVSGELELVQNMVDNFAYLINTVGFIPNGNRTYYSGRSQPPFFSLMVEILQEVKGPKTALSYRNELEKEYHFWMRGERAVTMPDGLILNRYWDAYDSPRPEAYLEDIETAEQSSRPHQQVYRDIRAAAESGWDFSSRWFRDPFNMSSIQTTQIIPLDLNCLLLFLESSLLDIYRQLNNKELAGQMLQQMRKREQAIQKYCWDESRGFYFDYHITDQHFSGTFSLAAAFPLFFNIAGEQQAYKVSGILEEHFLKEGGLVTTLTHSGQQWDAPNGWSPLQWIAYKGLKNYGLEALARKIKERWMQTNERVYAATGKMMEKYDVTDSSNTDCGGEYPNQDGFGWTNGIYLKLFTGT